MATHPFPKDIRILPDGIHIYWDDTHQSYYEHRYLRAECSCAHCVSEMTGKRIVSIDDIRTDVEALDWLQIGRYALQFLWSDAHTTGIYPFIVLRKLCRCTECSSSSH